MRGMRVLGVALVAAPWVVLAVETVPPSYDARIFRVSPSDADPCAKAAGYVRALKSANGGKLPRGGVIVEFEDGAYPLADTWRFAAEDSGTPECPVVYRAAHPGRVVFSGEASLDWRPLSDEPRLPSSAELLPDAIRKHVLTARIPDDWEMPSFFGASRYIQDELLDLPEYQYPWALFEDGVRLEPARWPNRGTALITEIEGPLQTNWIYVISKKATAFG